MADTPSFLWTSHPVFPGQSTALEVGPLTLRFRRERDELWLGSAPTPGAVAPARALPESAWTRWALPQDAPHAVHLAPTLPDRLLVVKPQPVFRLAPGADVRVYVRVPVWVQIRLGDGGGPLVAEVPTVLMSDTWWGDMESGSLGYWLDTTARRTLSSELLEPHLAVCTMELTNQAREPLPVEKIALRVVHLSVFGSPEGLWCEEVRVRYSGDDESSLEMTGLPPREAEGAGLLSAPRVPADRGLRARTFAALKGLPGLGIMG